MLIFFRSQQCNQTEAGRKLVWPLFVYWTFALVYWYCHIAYTEHGACEDNSDRIQFTPLKKIRFDHGGRNKLNVRFLTAAPPVSSGPNTANGNTVRLFENAHCFQWRCFLALYYSALFCVCVLKTICIVYKRHVWSLMFSTFDEAPWS